MLVSVFSSLVRLTLISIFNEYILMQCRHKTLTDSGPILND